MIPSQIMAGLEIGPIEGVGILGGGTAFPRRALSNADVLRSLPGDRARSDEALQFAAEGLEQTLGVRERAWTHLPGTPLDPASEENTLDLAIPAARAALTDAGVAASDLSLVACFTSTPHRMTSTVAGALGAALGARCACVDTRAGCASGLFALATAALYQQAGSGPALLVGTETFSKVIPPQSKQAAISLGDGAGALVLGRRDHGALLSAFFETDGTLGKLISTDGALPPTEAEMARGGYVLSGAPDELAQVIPGKYQLALRGALARARLTAADVDLFVPHQTSRELIRKICGLIDLPHQRAFVNVEKHANVGAAGWIAALAEARAAGLCPPGTRLLIGAVGGGMSWGAAVLRC
jgi:3-oxoacyl-[acyl-carrier-protein] synthase-3